VCYKSQFERQKCADGALRSEDERDCTYWRTVTGATGNRLDVSTSSSLINHVPGYENLDVGNTTSRNVTELTKSTNYYYRLRAYNAGGTSPNSNVVSVKTKPH
jgi:hypothetical protein